MNHPSIVKEGMFMHECSHIGMHTCLDTTEADWINRNHISNSHYCFRLPVAYLTIEGETLKKSYLDFHLSLCVQAHAVLKRIRTANGNTCNKCLLYTVKTAHSSKDKAENKVWRSHGVGGGSK